MKNSTAGGCANNRETYQDNPKFQAQPHKFDFKKLTKLMF